MRSAFRRQQGQAAVEFVLFTILLVVALALFVQLAWLAIQKWQFNHFAAYSARVWAVQRNYEPLGTIGIVQARSLVRWDLFGKDYAKVVFAYGDSQSYDDEDVTANGMTVWGYANVLPMFEYYMGDLAVPDVGGFNLPDLLGIDTGGLVTFSSFIPMEKEANERPDISNRDNDCWETPCESGNGR